MKSFQPSPDDRTSLFQVSLSSNHPIQDDGKASRWLKNQSLRLRETESFPVRQPLRSALTIDYSGVCRPAEDVPGNFMHTESLSDGALLFAIGETELAPDPLPTLCIRHYLHRSLYVGIPNPMSAASAMNGLIYDCCESHSSLSCFYAHYTRANNLIRYVNAGHDAPVLIRSNPDEVLRLEKGGPVFGLQEAPRYVEGLINLKPGDRLVAFTHGIIDALASTNDRSAESVLIALVRQHKNSTAAQLANLIIAECEDVRSARQFDGSVFVAAVEDVEGSSYSAAALNMDTVLAEA